jgi:hypothetical protein
MVKATLVQGHAMKEELPELPPLPEAAYSVWDDYYDGITLSENGPYDRYSERELFNPDQMRAYGLECYRAGMEKLAQRFDREAMDLHAMNAQVAPDKKTIRYDTMVSALRKCAAFVREELGKV